MVRNIEKLLAERILVLDGAMGTMIQRYDLKEEDYRGEEFAQWSISVRGNNDLLNLTRPDVISAIHKEYLEAGADIIETNSFNATTVSMEEYGMAELVDRINTQAVRLARQAADEYTKKNPNKPRFVAGSVGPTGKTLSMSPDVENPAYRALTFDQLSAAYKQQISILIKEGVDVLLIETIFDTLNAKAALWAANQVMNEQERNLPLMLSLTLSDSGGRTLSGQTLEAFLVSVERPILSVGLNCSFGARDMKPFLEKMAQTLPYYISAYPNAGLPNRFGQYDETPEVMAIQIQEYIDEKLVNILGGCCGTTPQHIAAYQILLNKPHEVRKPQLEKPLLRLSGLESLIVMPENNFINIGERCNVAGSRMFLRLIHEKKYDQALQIARRQVEAGAQIIDVNLDDAMLDAEQEMTQFLNLIASEPEISKVPLMIDSSKWEVLLAGLKCTQGKSIVNSISLKEGEELFLKRATAIQNLGAAVVVMAFDEEGQADTFERKIQVCKRAYDLLTQKIAFTAQDIIFDPNVLAIATGMDEHRHYAVDFIEATAWIKQNLPLAKVSGGISNLSFSFRGNNYIREAMHSVFLYHAIRVGLDMGIVNPATSVLYSDISENLLELIEDAVLDRRDDATERLIEAAQRLKDQTIETRPIENIQENRTIQERLVDALVKGDGSLLETYLAEAMQYYGSAVTIIDQPLMEGMNKVGELFGQGKMFLPQVVKTARTMKQAVAILQPHIEQEKSNNPQRSAGKFLLATVKGDVHDIGKNIAAVILMCNSYQVIDLGVMVPMEKIVEKAIEENVDYIALSGLITPSLDEMCQLAMALQKRGVKIPLMISGATTSALHTAVKIAPLYNAPVIHLKDASQNPLVAAKLKNRNTRQEFLDELEREQKRLRASIQETQKLQSFQWCNQHRLDINYSSYQPYQPKESGRQIIEQISIESVIPYINWKPFFQLWRIDSRYIPTQEILSCTHCQTVWLASFTDQQKGQAIEALKLYTQTMDLLRKWQRESESYLSAVIGLFPAYSKSNDIYIKGEKESVLLPTLRQQQTKSEADPYYAMADFISSSDDFIGVFSVTISSGIVSQMDCLKEDQYQILLAQSLADRLVEAASEWLHQQVRKNYWGYESETNNSIDQVIKGRYQGIRPAVGYPSLPDQSLIFDLNRLINVEEIGVRLTENGAMSPASSVMGLYFSHPQSRYFMVGQIDQEQRLDYAKRKGINQEQLLRWIPIEKK